MTENNTDICLQGSEPEAAPSEEISDVAQSMTNEETDQVPEDNIDALKAEISDLRSKLREQDEETARKVLEVDEFNRLFPDASISDLPDRVTELTSKGVPLSAAYALYEKETLLEKEKAGKINRKNAFLSAGRVGTHTQSEFFSPDEVRAMSQKQVHENYSKIRESMKHWRNKTFY